MLSELNDAQVKAVTAPKAPTLVLAGAGAGKTRVITHRILYLIEQGVPPQEILAVTFTNKAANELKARIQRQCRIHTCALPMVCTFHSLGVFILRNSIHLLGRENSFIIYDQQDSEKIIKNCLQKFNIKDVSDYASKISMIKNDPKCLDLFFKNNNIRNVYNMYEEQLQQANAVDFDDLLVLTVKLLQEVPEAKQYYNTLWQAILIDEYQDTNNAQYKIAKLLSQTHNNIFVVGDPDQSIYSWRGANIRNILEFKEDFPNAKTFRLEENYRSCSNILNAANALISHNTQRMEKTLKSVKGPGHKIQLFIGGTDRQESDFVAGEIYRLKQKSSKLSFSDICIFYRTNSQSRVFETALSRLRIPYQIFGGLSFYKRREIQDILAFLRLITFPRDTVAFERALKIITEGFGPASLDKILSHTEDHAPLWVQRCQQIISFQQVKLSKKQQQELTKFIQIFERLDQKYKAMSSLSDFINTVIEVSNYLQILQKEPDYASRKENIGELISAAYEWENQKDQGTLKDFLDELALKSSADDSQQTDCVNLMTIHHGKGLEFRVAFLVGLEEKLLPHSSNIDENLEEERRLCYVGITRAEDLLYLTAARSRNLWGRTVFLDRSRFLREVPQEYIQLRRC